MSLLASPWFWLAMLLYGIAAGGTGANLDKRIRDGDAQRAIVDQQKAMLAAEDAATKRHRAEELRQSAIDMELTRARNENEKLKANDRERALAGDLRLRFNGTCPQPAPTTPADTGQRDARAPAEIELPGQITADLYALADDADGIVEDLRACQAIAQSDRL